MRRALKWIGLLGLVALAGWGVVLTVMVYMPVSFRGPVYRAEGIIRISFGQHPSPPNNQALGFGDEYINGQAELIRTRPILEAASRRPEWAHAKLPTDQASLKAIANELKTEHPPRTELIRISYIHEDKTVAASTVKAIVWAYHDYARGRAADEEGSRLIVLEDDRARWTTKLGRIDQQLQKISSTLGVPNPDVLIEVKVREEAKLESLQHEAELELESAMRAAATKAGTRPVDNDPSILALQGRVGDIRKKVEEVRKHRREIGQQLADCQDLRRQREEIIKERQAVQDRIEMVQRELMTLGRVSIVNEGSEPTEPYRGK